MQKIKGNQVIKEIITEMVFYGSFFIFILIIIYVKIYEKGAKPLILEASKVEISTENILKSDIGIKDKKYVASSRGKYFYENGSSRANSLSENNKVYFNTAEEAKKLGFKPYIEG